MTAASGIFYVMGGEAHDNIWIYEWVEGIDVHIDAAAVCGQITILGIMDGGSERCPSEKREEGQWEINSTTGLEQNMRRQGMRAVCGVTHDMLREEALRRRKRRELRTCSTGSGTIPAGGCLVSWGEILVSAKCFGNVRNRLA
jgi:hypothetical protein